MSMFNNPTNKKGDEKKFSPESSLSMIAPGAVIDGNVISEGEIRVEGRVIGTLVCRSRLIVGSQGVVEGNIDATNATIAGTVHGSVIVREVLQIHEHGRIFGDIITEKLVIQAGGIFTGNCKMGDEAKQILKAKPMPNLLAGKEKIGSNHLPVNLNKAQEQTA